MRLAKLVCAVVITAILCIGISIAITRNGGRSCLWIQRVYQNTFVDPQSGASVNIVNSRRYLDRGASYDESSDGNYSGYRLTDNSKPTPTLALWVYSMRSGNHPQPILIAD